jgi:hypothetical protein
MATGAEVLRYLIPTGGWVIAGDTWEGVQFLEAKPITKQEFEAGFDKVDAWQKQAEIAKAAEKSALLTRLGLTDAEAKLLLS